NRRCSRPSSANWLGSLRLAGLASARSTSSARASAAGSLSRSGRSQEPQLGEVPEGCFAHFWRKRSTRPAVSTRRRLPVKKGWQAEQTSVWISARVERVRNVFPHAHFTVAVAYSGWMSDFTEYLSGRVAGVRGGFAWTLSRRIENS